MNVKRTYLSALVSARLKVEAQYEDEWQVLTKADIRQHFMLAPSPVFRVNGLIYHVKTRIWRGNGVSETELFGLGRAECLERVRQKMIANIHLDELSYQHMLGCASRHWVYSVRFSDHPIIALVAGAGYRRYHEVVWRVAVVWPVVRPPG